MLMQCVLSVVFEKLEIESGLERVFNNCVRCSFLEQA
jgi:hypothetical protein